MNHEPAGYEGDADVGFLVCFCFVWAMAIGQAVGLYFFGNGGPNRDIYYLEVMHCFARVCAPLTQTPSLTHHRAPLSHTYTHTTHAPLFPSTSTHVHVRRIGAKAAVSMLVNFRQKRNPPLDGCARSQLLNIFTSADRFVFIILSSELLFSLRYPYRYCTRARPRFLSSPPDSPSAVRVF